MKIVRRIALVGIVIILAIIIIPLVGAGLECRVFADVTPAQNDTSPERQRIIADVPDYARGEDQTYLTLPEWYIVFNADEYAAFINTDSPSRFPYFQAIGQFWRSYYQVCGVIQGKYAFNSEYQMTLAVIGASFTLENIIRGGYEFTVGRVADWLSSDTPTEEELYARNVAQQYGDFIHFTPWYEFPFAEKLSGLWRETSLWGPNIIRKWERKVALSVEYGGKALYAWLLNLGADAAFSPIKLETQFWAEGITDEVLQQEPELRIVKSIDEQAAIAAVPRYEPFTQIVPRLAEQGVQFAEIAGNDQILITIIAPEEWVYDIEAGEVIFSMDYLSRPEFKRIAVNVPVPSLHVVLNELAAQGIELEHIYDY